MKTESRSSRPAPRTARRLSKRSREWASAKKTRLAETCLIRERRIACLLTWLRGELSMYQEDALRTNNNRDMLTAITELEQIEERLKSLLTVMGPSRLAIERVLARKEDQEANKMERSGR